MANWGGELPDRPGDWSAFDVLLIGLAFVLIVVIGVWQS